MARKIVAGNWKMNLLATEAASLLAAIRERSRETECELIICPPAIYLQGFSADDSEVSIGGQNVAKYDKGAYTGEWSAAMLENIGVTYCLVGHSERRSLFGETDEDVNQKTKLLLQHGLKPIVCCGETLEQRNGGQEKEIVRKQIEKALNGVGSDAIDNVIVAYEPVWAIGTGVTASADQAQEMHAFIRTVLVEFYGEKAQNIPLLYGGSCKPSNAAELFTCNDIDGGLIGGASLEADSFLEIAKSF